MMRTKVTVHCDGPTCGRNTTVPPRHVTGAHHLVEAIPGWIAVALQDREEWWEESRLMMRTFCSTSCLDAYQRDLSEAIRHDVAQAEADAAKANRR